MTGRAGLLPALVAAALVVACAAIAVTTSREAGAAFPGANGKVAFSAYTLAGDGSINPYDVYTVNPNGSGTTNLTRTPDEYEDDPSFSPSGMRMVYTHIPANSSNEDVYTMNADGTNQRRLTSDPDYDSSPTFSPSGRRIVFASYRDGDTDSGRDADIYVMNADGSGTSLLTRTAVDELDPTWSPDGTKIAFGVAFSDTASGLYTMNADGTGRKKLVATGAYDFVSPDFRPDGRKIVFDLDGAIYSINTDGSTRRKLYGAGTSPHYSPDGEKITFARNENFDRPQGLRVMNADGTGARDLNATVPGRVDMSPSWGSR